jgi:hypothetical protein
LSSKKARTLAKKELIEAVLKASVVSASTEGSWQFNLKNTRRDEYYNNYD